ncbi:hypothetical protein WN51_04967 [Melipona quadrifasciata]|uniref:Uncharacterized protein n=1 Tax=Melipona quadrifasciata TaxID=166423 RepID=A0A0M8ZRK9_9HYME|nr:hypothetical protein WN51_04967 [Melipona quadrifasciata]
MGITETSLPKAFMAGTQLSRTINTKYILATRRNCSRKLRGRKLSIVYFVVRTLKRTFETGI